MFAGELQKQKALFAAGDGLALDRRIRDGPDAARPGGRDGRPPAGQQSSAAVLQRVGGRLSVDPGVPRLRPLPDAQRRLAGIGRHRARLLVCGGAHPVGRIPGAHRCFAAHGDPRLRAQHRGRLRGTGRDAAMHPALLRQSQECDPAGPDRKQPVRALPVRPDSGRDDALRNGGLPRQRLRIPAVPRLSGAWRARAARRNRGALSLP